MAGIPQWNTPYGLGIANSSFGATPPGAAGSMFVSSGAGAPPAFVNPFGQDLRKNNRSIFEFLTAPQQADVFSGNDPTIDLTSVINAALTQMAGGKLTMAGGGRYLIEGSVSILSALTWEFESSATLYLGTQNMNGIVVGDGTSGPRNAVAGTKIITPNIAPLTAVSAFTSGAAFFRNNVSDVDIINPNIYGKDAAGTSKLFDGFYDYMVAESDVIYSFIQYLLGRAWHPEGDGTTAGAVTDCNFDFARIYNCNIPVFVDTGCAGLGMERPTIYKFGSGQWAIHFNCTPGPQGQNFFINTPDIELDTGVAGGVWVENGERVRLNGGWIGDNGAGNVPAIKFDTGADSCSTSVDTTGAHIELLGLFNRVDGGDIAGDATTSGAVGILIGGEGSQVSDAVKIRQWLGNGIGFTGTPSNVSIGAQNYNTNGRDIASLAAFTNGDAPVVADAVTDQNQIFTAAATVDIPANLSFVQITGGTTITTLVQHGRGKSLAIQAGSGGITIGSGGNIIGFTGTVAAFEIITLVCDGQFWFKSV